MKPYQISQYQVAVIGGTVGDTRLGEYHVRQLGLSSRGFVLASTPTEQTQLQYFDQEELLRRLSLIVSGFEAEKPAFCLLFCNSVSLAIDIAVLQDSLQELGIQLISPTLVYTRVGRQFARPFVIAANATTLAAIERLLLRENIDIQVAGYHSLDLANDNEATSPDHSRSLRYLKNVAELAATRSSDCIVLACTHLTGISQVQFESKAEVLDVGTILLNQLHSGVESNTFTPVAAQRQLLRVLDRVR